MKNKKHFETPRVLKQVPVQLERDLLWDSVRLNMNVMTMGQEVETYDFSEDNGSYTAEWE